MNVKLGSLKCPDLLFWEEKLLDIIVSVEMENCLDFGPKRNAEPQLSKRKNFYKASKW